MAIVAKEGLPLKEKTLTQKQLKEQKELERAEGRKNKPLYGQSLRAKQRRLGMMLPGIGFGRWV